MTNHFEPLDNGEVLSINESALIFIGHTTFRVGEFSEAVRHQLEKTDGWNESKNPWFTDAGVPCEVLRFTSGGWQKGKVRIRLEFSPDSGEGSDTKESAQGTDEDTEPEGESFFVEGASIDPLESITTEAVLNLEDSLPEEPPENFAIDISDTNTPDDFLDNSVDTLDTVDSVNNDLNNDLGNDPDFVNPVDSDLDDNFNLAPPTPESELLTMEDNFLGSSTDSLTSNLDDLETDFVAESTPEFTPESADFDLESADFVLEENPTPELNSLEDVDFGSIEVPDQVSNLEDVDFESSLSLEENFADSSNDLSSLEDTNVEDTNTAEADLGGLDDLDFELGETPEPTSEAGSDFSALEDVNEDDDLSPDFSLVENSDVNLSDLDDADFGLESNDLELSNLVTEDFGLEESPDVELLSLGTEEFSGEFSGEFSEESEPSPEFAGDALDFGEQEFGLEAAVVNENLNENPTEDNFDDTNDEFDLSSLDVGALDDGELEVSGLEGAFSESAEADLSELGEYEFTLESQGLDPEFAGLMDDEFDLEPIAPESTNFSSLESGLEAEFSLDIDSDTNSETSSDFDLENFGNEEDQADQEADFDSELTNDFIFEADSTSEATTGLEETDFGLDEFLGEEETVDELESLQISVEDRQEFELAAAEVSQAFDEDFGLDLENFGSEAGDDGLNLSLVEEEELDAIDKQLAEALNDDLDFSDTSTGLTENLFVDQEDSLFKDIWDDMNKKVK